MKKLVKALRTVRKPTAKCRRLANALKATREVKQAAPAKGGLRFVASRIRLKARVSSSGNRAFSGMAYTGGIMYPTITLPGGRTERGPVILDLASLTIPTPERPVLDDHDESPEGTIGRTSAIAVNRAQWNLPVKGVLYAKKVRAQKYLELAPNGHKWQLSVGTDSFRVERIPKGQSVRVNGRRFQGPVSVVRDAYLTDLSFVAKGADDLTEAVIEARRRVS